MLTTPGFVYFIQGEKTGLIKIGWALRPEGRLKALQPMCPDKLILLTYFAGNGRQEKRLHQKFAADRSHGEWFNPAEGLLKYVEWMRQHGHRFKWKAAA